jgi:hypothetical protein
LTQVDSNPAPEPAPRKRPKGIPRAALGVGAATLIVLVGVYAARNAIAREALLGWLRARGVPAQADVGALGLGGVTGRIIVGAPANPDFSVETSEIDYDLKGPWSGDGFGLEIRSVRLVRPVLRAGFKGGKLSFGSLDPVIEELRRRPPRPDMRQPHIRVEAGRVLVDSDYGRADVRADAELNDGKLLALDARLAPTSLKQGALAADFGASRLTLRTRGDRVDLDLDARIARLVGVGFAADAAHIRLTGQGPYPDLKRRRGDGVVTLNLVADAEAAEAGGTRLQAPRLTSAFNGRSAGWVDTLVLTGSGTADAAAAGVAAPGVAARNVTLALIAETVNWMRPGGDRVMSDIRATGAAAGLDAGLLRLRTVNAGLAGPVSLGAAGHRVDLHGALSARGAIEGTPAPVTDDVAEVVAVKRTLRDFTLAAPGAGVGFDDRGLALTLSAPVRLKGPTGGEAVLTAAPGRPLFRDGRGAFDVATAGGGLPRAKVAVDGLRLTGGGVIAPMRLDVRSDFEPVRDGRVEASGELRVVGGITRFVTRRCAPYAAGRLEFGDNDVTGLTGELCPGAQPLFEFRDGSWRVRGKVRQAKAQLVLLQTAVSEGAGAVEFGQTRGALTAAVNLESTRLEDVAPLRRFHPLRASGPALLREGVWQAAVAVADSAGRRLGEAQVSHDVRSGVGEANIDTGELAFAEGGLQPAALSPLAAALASPVRGRAGFTGIITWSPQGVESSGSLTIPQLDFTSPLGAVHGLSGEIAFTSLVPLAAPPEQRLRAAAVDGFAKLTALEATFGLGGEALQIRSAKAAVGGGEIFVDPLDIPFAPDASFSGVLHVEGVQLSDMVEASPFADRVDLDARVSGRLPFQRVPQGVRVAKGELRAVEPGRLSIRREALTDVAAVEAGPAAEPQAAPNAFSDFAYQAMEHLAFDTLTAKIDSLPQGRLGVLFHIKGEHQPPKRQVLKVGVDELLNRSFLNKSQPLPSGTKVDLTLDTTLNLDQLLGDFAGFQKLGGSGDVQAQGTKTHPTAVERTK